MKKYGPAIPPKKDYKKLVQDLKGLGPIKPEHSVSTKNNIIDVAFRWQRYEISPSNNIYKVYAAD